MTRILEKKCEICGRNGNGDPLDLHHVFFGTGLRKLSDKYGAVCYLCHDRCHENGPHAVHRDIKASRKLQAKYQLIIMKEQGWSTPEEFIKVFGRSYL